MIGIGSNYTFDPLQYGSCNINIAIAESLGLNDGDYMVLETMIDELL